MRNTYIFSDWTSVSQMINSQYPDLRAKASVLRGQSCSSDCGGRTQGYCLTIYNHVLGRTVCRVMVNSGESSFWSLSESQAVEMLNDFGFICRLERDSNMISDKVRKSLEIISSLGYSHVIRNFSKGHGQVSVFVSDNLKRHPQNLSGLLSDYNYYDWVFLREGSPTLIEGILNGGSVND